MNSRALPDGSSEEHGRLLARLAGEAGLGLDEEARAGRLQPLGQRLPGVEAQDEAEVAHRHVLAVDGVGGAPSASAGARWATIWWPWKSKSTQSSAERPSGATQQPAVEGPRLGEVADRKGEMESWTVHGRPLKRGPAERKCRWTSADVRRAMFAPIRQLRTSPMNAVTLDLNGWTAVGEALLPEAIALRRAIHAEPELGLDLPKTTAKVKAALAGLPLEIREGPSTSGVVAILRGPANGRTVLLRGDMDALPLTEDTGLPFTSEHDGAMHACGHDTHVAMLAGAARALCERRDRLTGSVMFMFQPGEEGWHGARFMLEDGLLDPMPDAAFALHISPNMPHRRDRQPRRPAAGLVRQDPHQGEGQGRPRLDAPRRPRPDPDRLRDRPGAAGLRHPPHRRCSTRR